MLVYKSTQLCLQKVSVGISISSVLLYFHIWSVLSGWGLHYTDMTLTSGFLLGHQLDWLWNQPIGKPVRGYLARSPEGGRPIPNVGWGARNPPPAFANGCREHLLCGCHCCCTSLALRLWALDQRGNSPGLRSQTGTTDDALCGPNSKSSQPLYYEDSHCWTT